MHANIFGDFVKGRNLNMYLPKVKEGIVLHRKIDDYIDHHPEVKRLVLQLSPSLPKVSGIAVDIYFDHFLVKHWNEFHPQDLETFLNKFYNFKIDENHYPNELFLQVLFRMKKGKWLSDYGDLQGVEGACIGVSRRLSFPNALMNARMVLENHYKTVEKAFFDYMKDAIKEFEIVN